MIGFILLVSLLLNVALRAVVETRATAFRCRRCFSAASSP